MREGVLHGFIKDDVIPARLLDFVVQLAALIPSAIEDKDVVVPV